MKWHRERLIHFLALGAWLFLLLPVPTAAQSDDWSYDLALYGLAAGLEGKASVGLVTADVDVGFSDVLENLEAGALVFFRAEKGRLAVMTDVIFLGVGVRSGPFDLDADEFLVEVDFAYGFAENAEVFFGARFVDVEVEIDVEVPLLPDTRATGGDEWVDPVIGLRFDAPLGGRWSVLGRADVGGFGIGSDFSWQAALSLGVHPSDGFSVYFGYRVLDIDYEDGEGRDRFLHDIRTQGPQIAFAFHF